MDDLKASGKKRAILDPDVLTELRALDSPGTPPMIAELGNLFLSTLPEKLKAIDSALSASDFDSVRRITHSLKSSAGNMGAFGLSNELEIMESLAAQSPVKLALVEIFNRINADIPSVVTALELEIKRMNEDR